MAPMSMGLVSAEALARLRDQGFDGAAYGARYPDVAMVGMDPAEHFLWIGQKLGRRWGEPKPVAGGRGDTLHRQVAAALAGVVVGDLPPARRPARGSAVWSAPWAARQAGRAVSFRRVMGDGRLAGVDPHPLFDTAFYGPVVGEHGLAHYRREGWRQGRDPHPLFCNDWYLAQNPDAADSGLSPLEHYLSVGWRRGARPNPLFDPAAYLALYGDVAREGMEPLTHYVAHGMAEGRAVPGAPGDMARLLRTAPPVLLVADWPPAPVDGYWLPQTLRDVVISGHGEGAVGLYWYLCSLMERWRGQEGFADSQDCADLVARMRGVPVREPEVSIIVPVYNNLLDTMLCLASVLECGGPGFEVIVADDASTDETARVVGGIGGVVRHLRQGGNLGFLRNCNGAVAAARGRHVVLLNNDTLVLPGWLEALLAPFERDGVGLVGAKLINWDGTLQEAGGIYWRDGSAWNFGRGGDVRAPQFNYLKDVDYCSGAAIALPRAVWDALSGFDEHYLPAYCEDADLAFRVRAMGLRCLYQPRAEVVHHEGRSHGRDVASGGKAYQIANQAKLRERWAGVLAGHYDNACNVLRARDRSFDRPHILVIDHYVPKVDQDAGSRSVFSMIGALVESGWAVTFWPDNLHEDPDYTPLLQAMGVEVMYGPALAGRFGEFWGERADLYDAVLLSRPHVAERYLKALRGGRARLIHYGHDLHHRRLGLQAALQNGGAGGPSAFEIARVKAQEIAVARACDVTLLPSEEEAAMMRALVPGADVRAVPLMVVESAARPAREPDGVLRLLFVGGFGHPPNGDAVLWFAQAVAPVLRARGVAFHLSIVGGGAGADVRALAGEDMAVLGRVDDAALADLYDGADVVIAPLRFGAGVKGKVVEAMARGVPVATTAVGAQGLAGASLFLGEDAEGFADAVIRARDGQAEAAACVGYVQRYFSQAAMARVLNDCAAPGRELACG